MFGFIPRYVFSVLDSMFPRNDRDTMCKDIFNNHVNIMLEIAR